MRIESLACLLFHAYEAGQHFTYRHACLGCAFTFRIDASRLARSFTSTRARLSADISAIIPRSCRYISQHKPDSYFRFMYFARRLWPPLHAREHCRQLPLIYFTDTDDSRLAIDAREVTTPNGQLIKHQSAAASLI